MSAETEKDETGDFESGLAAFIAAQEKGEAPADPPLNVADEEEEEEKPAGPSAPAAEPFPGFSTLPQEVQDHYNKLAAERDEIAKAKAKVDNDFRAMHSRVAPVQTEANQLRDALRDRDALIKKLEGQKQATPSDSKWAKFISSLPEEDRAAFEEDRAIRQAEIAELKEALKATGGTVGEIRTQLVTQKEIASLDETHAGWFETVQSEEYETWLERQPKPVQALADSKDANDYRYLLDTFRATTQTQTPPQTKEEQIAEARKAVAKKAVPVSRGSASGVRASVGPVDGDDPGWIAYLREKGELK